MKLVFIVGYGASALPLLRRVLEEESARLAFEFLAISDLEAEGYVNEIRSADAILIYAPVMSSSVEDAITASRAVIIASPSDSHASRGDSLLVRKTVEAFKVGGEANLRVAIRALLRGVGAEVEVGDVERVPWHGIYHPSLGVCEDVREYLSRYRRRPLVGIIFHRNQWLYGNLEHVDALIGALEEEGLGAMAVFTQGFRDPSLGVPAKEDTVREFFLMDGKVVVDAVVHLAFFFLLDHGAWYREGGAWREMSGVALLRHMGVPVLQAVISSSQSVEEWLRDERGVSYLSQVYTVIMPEVDGVVEPVFLAGAEMGEDGVKRYLPYVEHARYLARRARKWIELRRTPPEERRVAIILINPPCKGLEANVAVGFGLDVPESVVKLLHALRDAGYDLGPEIPETGEDLIRMIMERKAISEFRWTSVESIVSSGGALGFVDYDRYMEWFSELPADVRERMLNDWGDPGAVLRGEVERELVGMVYDGKFVVPGLRFGKIVVMPQPKFGCAGPACDGRVCRVLHDPTISPPHQWLAVYRWITREFRAHIMMHFGTHGYLEFRPGKGVGLSPSCWPEISVDCTPHLYVYNVSNPMEGVIAKRRGYATIMDHLYPPLTRADVLEDLEALLAQHSHATSLGERERASIIEEEIKRKAEELNLKCRDVEALHRFVESVRNTQVEDGLHVLGRPPSEVHRLAEYVATVMAKDSPTAPSLMRAVAEHLGLNYDEMRKNPHGNALPGMTNSEVLERIRTCVVKCLEDLLKRGVGPEDLSEEMLMEALERAGLGVMRG